MRESDRDMLKDVLFRGSNRLKDDEFVIVARRFGLDDNPPLKTFELSQLLKLSVEQVRQKTRWALMKIRDLARDTEAFDRLMADIAIIRLQKRER